MFEHLQRGKEHKHCAVVDRQRHGGDRAPTCAGGAAFEKRKTVGIEQRAAERRQPERFVFNAPEHGAEHSEQSCPGIVPTFQDLVAEAFLFLAQLGAQRGDGVVLIVNRFSEQQELPLFGAEQHNEPHHDGEPGLIKLRRRDVLQKLAVTILVGAIQRLHQDFDGAAHLFPKRVGDFVLMFERAQEQGFKCAFRRAEAPTDFQQGNERLQGDRFLLPDAREPCAQAGTAIGRHADNGPALAVGNQSDTDASSSAQHGHALNGRG